MSRRSAAKKREVVPDRKYGSCLISKFVNCVMQDGKKAVAESLVYDALDALEKQMNTSGIEIFNDALANISPSVELRSFRAGGVNYRVPVPIKGDRSDFIAMRWLLGEALKRKGAPAAEKICMEVVDAYAKRGGAFKKYEENLKVAESSRAFSHFRFFNRNNNNNSNNSSSNNSNR